MTRPSSFLVGRGAELASLEASLAEAAEGRPGTVMLGGEAGVGKSRLVHAFAEWARESKFGAQVLLGRCMDLAGGTVPYAPLVDALRRVTRDGAAEALSLDAPAYTALSALIADFTGVQPAVGAPAVGGSQLHVFGAVMRLLEQVGRQAPVVLIFEDVHWADASTLDLVSFLTQAKSTERLLLVCSHRTDGRYVDGRLAAMLAEPQFRLGVEQIDLGRFSREELRNFLVESGVPAPSPRLVERYFELSEGNPLFLGELVRTGIEQVPEGLRAIVLSRYHDLPEDAQQLLRVAAAAGQRVGTELLMATSGLPDDRLVDALRRSVDGHALVVDRTERSYVFWHALLREAVYEQEVHPVERVVLHTRMAKAIEQDHSLGQVGGMTAKSALAYHWFQAGRKREALLAALDAAEAAAAGRVFPEALMLYRRALDLWREVPQRDRPAGAERIRLLVEAADAARWSGEVGVAVDLIRQAIDATGAGAGPVPLEELWERLGSFGWEAGDYGASASAYERAAELMDDRPSAGMARVLNGLAGAALQADRYKVALSYADRAEAMARTVDASAEESRALSLAGLALTLMGRPADGVQRLGRANGIAQRIEHLEYLFRGYANLGVALEHAGRLSESAEVAREGLAHARRLHLARTRQGSVLANNLATTLVLLGEWDEALEIIAGELPDRTVEMTRFLRLTRADIEVARGDLDAAEHTLSEIRGEATPRFAGLRAVCDAELAYWRGEPTDDVLRIVEAGIAVLGEAENTTVRLQLLAAGLRVTADKCDSLRLPRHREDRERVLATADRLMEGVRAAATPAARALPEVRALVQWCEAERERASGRATAAAWEEVAALWDELDRPYPAACARWRGAFTARLRGDRTTARRLARAAMEVAERLETAPLLARLEPLAETARPAPGRPATQPVESAEPAGKSLTPRQREVVDLAGQGLTDAEIGRELNIAEKTVSRHMGDAMTRLGARNRTDAARIAREEGLL